MGEVLSIDEIEKRYPDHWILIGDYETAGDTPALAGGVVLYAGDDREAMHRRAMEVPPPRRLAIRCTQAMPDDEEFVL